MTVYGWIFRWFGWLFSILLIVGELTPWRDGRVDPVSRLLGVALLVAWCWHWWRSLRSD